MYRNTYLEVDCNQLKNNIVEIKNNYPDYKYYFGVVKANGYGHGGYIINSLIEGGVNYLAVSSLEEAISLRKFNTEIPILCLEPINLDFMEECIKNNVTISVSNIEYFNKLIKLSLSGKLKIHIKIDSGMSRLGIKNADEVFEIVSNINKNSNLFLEGIYTHFATSGILDKHWDDQLENFKNATSKIDLSAIPIVHMARSLTLVNHKKIPFCNGTRLGIITYGMSQSMPKPSGLKGKLLAFKNSLTQKKLNVSETTTTNNLQIKPAITLKSEVMEIREIHENDFVGYGAKFISNSNARIATIPIGYADGLPKTIKHVAINNKLYNVAGDVCMDMIMVKVDNSISVGDIVTLIGGDLLPVKKVCAECGTNSYCLFTGITNRVPRVYTSTNSEKVEIKY